MLIVGLFWLRSKYCRMAFVPNDCWPWQPLPLIWGWPLLLLGLLLSVCISLIPASAGLGFFGAFSVLSGLLLATYGCGDLSWPSTHHDWDGLRDFVCYVFYVCFVRMLVSWLQICVLVTGLGILPEECGMFTGDVKSKLQVTLWLGWLRTSNHYVSDRSHMPSHMLIFWIWLYIRA